MTEELEEEELEEEEPRAYTVEEARQMFIEHLQFEVDHIVSSKPGKIDRELAHQLVFSILCAIDGVCGYTALTSIDLIVKADSEEDKAYKIAAGDKYFESDLLINESLYLHDLYYEKERKENEKKQLDED